MAIPATSFTPTLSLSTNLPTTPSSSSLLSSFSSQKTLNSTLKTLSKSLKLEEALRIIESQPSKTNSITPDIDTYSALLHACITLKSLEYGQRLHLQLLLSKGSKNLLKNPTLKAKLITLYSVCHRLDEAKRVFDDGFGERNFDENVFVAMAIGYSKNGLFREALLLYCEMLRCFVKPGNFSFSIGLKCCVELNELKIGRAIHGQICKCGDGSDQVLYNVLLRFYSECGCFDEVIRVFSEMPERNVATWNSLISWYVKRDQLFEAFGVFRRMQKEEVGYSWVTFTTILPVCGRVTALNFGKEIHAQMVKSAEMPDLLVLNSLVDMYAKCGVMDYCMEVFNGMQNKDLTSWNTVLTGFAINGKMKEAMEIFDEMLECGFRPDEITFTALLSGCSHTGLTKDGEVLFKRMSSEFGISPRLEHYACLVDILGRGGKMEEALEVLKTMPMKPGGSIWGSLLNSCRLYGNVPLAEAIAKRLFAIEPKNPGNYVMLSNIYASAGLWKDVDKMREIMERNGVKKEVGCSWLQIKSRLHTFVANGGLEFRSSDEFKKLWDELTDKMREIGYVPDTGEVLHNVNEEMKAMWVCGHSERIATMYGLIHTGAKLPIRITKNLRVCRDCHSWMKMVSRVTDRVVTLRDTNRFHHFENGLCSCNDFW